MKRNEVVLIGVILAPFLVLIVFTLVPPPEAPDTSTREEVRAVEALPVDAGITPTVLLIDAGAALVNEPPPPPLDPPTAAVAPVILSCLRDAQGRLGPDPSVMVSYVPLVDGGYADVRVDPSLQDPYVRACIEDAFLDVQFEPRRDTRFEPVQHRFSTSTQ